MIKKIIKKIVGSTGYRLVKESVTMNSLDKYKLSRDHFFDLYFSNVKKDDFFFVQIGANDGVTNDPLHEYVCKYDLKGLAVEPQEEVFKSLEKNYLGKNVTCIKAIVSNTTGLVNFYSVKDSLLNEDNMKSMTGISTLNKEVLRKTLKRKLSKDSNVDDFIKESSVLAVTFDELLKNNNVSKISFLQIDAEGYDFEILKQLNFNFFKPDVINFESMHLSQSDYDSAIKLLESHNYKFFYYKGDTCAYLTN